MHRTKNSVQTFAHHTFARKPCAVIALFTYICKPLGIRPLNISVLIELRKDKHASQSRKNHAQLIYV